MMLRRCITLAVLVAAIAIVPVAETTWSKEKEEGAPEAICLALAGAARRATSRSLGALIIARARHASTAIAPHAISEFARGLSA